MGFTELCHWIDPEGLIRLTDTRTFTFYDVPAEARHFDFDITLSAPGASPVLLHPTNEAGIPFVRVAQDLTLRRDTGAVLTNAHGRQEAGKPYNTYGKASPFLDYGGGKLGRLTCGIALFDHPDNPAYPTKWFTRDYGPISPNYGFFSGRPHRDRSRQSPAFALPRVYAQRRLRGRARPRSVGAVRGRGQGP